MKKYLFGFILTVILSGCLLSQWLPDMRITNDSAHSFLCFNAARGVSAIGNFVHIVWFDDRNGALNREIYYKRSTNSGADFEAEVRLTNSAAHSFVPCIEVSGSVVHVIWEDLRDGNDEIYYKRSSDNGATWGADMRLTNNSSWSLFPSLSVSGSYVHIVWDDARASNDEIFYKRSTDGGLTWEPDVRLTNNSSSSYNPSVSSAGSRVHVLWEDNREGNFEIFYKQSTDWGVNWGADMRITNNSSAQVEPCVTSSGSDVHISWKDSRDAGNLEIYYNRSTDGGITWGTDTRMTTTAGQTWYPSIWSSGENVHLVYNDYTGSPEIYYMRSFNAGQSWGTAIQLSAAHTSGGSFRPSLYVRDTAVHVVWGDTRNGAIEEIYYKRNPTGTLAVTNISTEIPEGFSIEQNYPNPFNPVTNIEFSIPENAMVRLVVYDILGKEIEILLNKQLSLGTYKADWNASEYPGGVYFCKMITGEFSKTMRMILIK